MPKLLRGANRQRYRIWRDRLFVFCIRGLRTTLARIGVRRAIAMGAVLGSLAMRLLPHTRRVSVDQMAAAFPDRSTTEIDRDVRQMFCGLGRTLVEVILLDEIAADLDAWVDTEGFDVLDRALAQGQGVIAITGHVGNWELMAATLGLHGYPLTAIATPVKGVALNQENIDLRKRVGVETLPRDGAGAAKAILRTLKAGRILGILMDQDTEGRGVMVPFFGRPAYTPVGPAVLSWRTGAPIVSVFIHRGADGRHCFRIRELDLPERHGVEREGREEWQRAATACLTRAIEEQIRPRPDQWVWWHQRWRRSAGGET